MDDDEVGQIWNSNAEGWTMLSRAGYDLYRDLINTPGFFEILPEVANLDGLDVGCGEGHNTRLLAQRGARMRAVDISSVFIKRAMELETHNVSKIEYVVGSALRMPFANDRFDFCTAFMSLMDIPNQELAATEIHRILKPNGFFQFSILHPCFFTPEWKWVTNATGTRIGLVCGRYFDLPEESIHEWAFEGAPEDLTKAVGTFRIPHFLRTLSGWMNMLIGVGFKIEQLNEPAVQEGAVRKYSFLSGAANVALFLHIRVRKL